MNQEKKCIVCGKQKKISKFAAGGQSPRCIDCKTKSDAKKKKPGQEYFGI